MREVRLDRHRLLGLVLDVHLEVILQVLTDARQLGNDVNPERLEVLTITDARQLQQLRAVERTAAQNDSPRLHRRTPADTTDAKLRTRPPLVPVEDDLVRPAAASSGSGSGGSSTGWR